MTLQQLKYILAISETGSMNKAAEQLYVSQPSLTSSVQELEKEIGIKIFNRSGRGNVKKKFGVSTQHYSFAVKAFVEMVKEFDTAEYEFAVRETKTAEVINDVATMRSEIGIIYLNDFNRKSITKLLHSNGLEFHTLTRCFPFVYLWKGHPLAKQKKITFEQLADYPCLSFEQGDNSTFYLAEDHVLQRDIAYLHLFVTVVVRRHSYEVISVQHLTYDT